jgi:hypothetical protein
MVDGYDNLDGKVGFFDKDFQMRLWFLVVFLWLIF